MKITVFRFLFIVPKKKKKKKKKHHKFANLKQIFELAQQSTLLLIVVALNEAPKATQKICSSLKQNPVTKNIPVVLVKNPGIQEQEQWADAYLTADFDAQDVEKVVRQLTMGY